MWETTPRPRERVPTPTPKDANAQETNKPNANEVVQGLLEKLGIQTQPTASAAGCAADSTGGVTVAQARETDVAKQQTEGLAVVAQASSGNVPGAIPKQQLTAPATAAAQTPGGGGVVVNCRYCGGCCNGLSGRRLPRRVVELIRLVKEVLGFKYECEVLNRWPELFCQRVRVRRSRVKARERELSRAVQFKASYLLGVVKHAGDLGEVVERLRLAFEDYLGYSGGGDVGGFINGLLRELGFGSLLELALYLWWLMPSEVYGVMRGLVEPVTATRRGWVNIIKLRCRLDGAEIPTTVGLPTFIRIAVGHFRQVHGLVNWRDVARAVVRAREGEVVEYDEYRAKLLKLSADVSLALRLIAHRLEKAGAVERVGKRYKCKLCNAGVGDVVEATAHFVNHHMNIMRTMRFDPHSSEPCEPGEIGASQVEEADTLTYRLACALRHTFGVRGPWYGEAERLLNKLRGGLACSEVALANAGFEPAGRYMEALREAGICF